MVLISKFYTVLVHLYDNKNVINENAHSSKDVLILLLQKCGVISRLHHSYAKGFFFVRCNSNLWNPNRSGFNKLNSFSMDHPAFSMGNLIICFIFVWRNYHTTADRQNLVCLPDFKSNKHDKLNWSRLVEEIRVVKRQQCSPGGNHHNQY